LTNTGSGERQTSKGTGIEKDKEGEKHMIKKTKVAISRKESLEWVGTKAVVILLYTVMPLKQEKGKFSKADIFLLSSLYRLVDMFAVKSQLVAYEKELSGRINERTLRYTLLKYCSLVVTANRFNSILKINTLQRQSSSRIRRSLMGRELKPA
jgi:hypothetical protein